MEADGDIKKYTHTQFSVTVCVIVVTFYCGHFLVCVLLSLHCGIRGYSYKMPQRLLKEQHLIQQ